VVDLDLVLFVYNQIIIQFRQIYRFMRQSLVARSGLAFFVFTFENILLFWKKHVYSASVRCRL
jgi:hypothetical protein